MPWLPDASHELPSIVEREQPSRAHWNVAEAIEDLELVTKDVRLAVSNRHRFYELLRHFESENINLNHRVWYWMPQVVMKVQTTDNLPKDSYETWIGARVYGVPFA